MKVTKIRVLGGTWEGGQRCMKEGNSGYGDVQQRGGGWDARKGNGARRRAIRGTGMCNAGEMGRRGRQKNNAAAARNRATEAGRARYMLHLYSK